MAVKEDKWWNGPTVEGRPVTERIEWESDDHSFVLTIDPLTPIERMDGSTPAPPFVMTRLDERD